MTPKKGDLLEVVEDHNIYSSNRYHFPVGIARPGDILLVLEDAATDGLIKVLAPYGVGWAMFQSPRYKSANESQTG